MRISSYIDQLKTKLLHVYDEREAQNIAVYLCEELFGKIVVRNNVELNNEQIQIAEQASIRLQNNEPIQYVLGEAWFYGKKFIVSPDVLIPRPETEELIEFILEKNKKSDPHILDIGTGSGCIPVILKNELPHAYVYSIDISDQALQIAQQNALRHAAEINFLHLDILNNSPLQLPQMDMIVSNPPYVDPADATSLHKNVIDHEPHLALFGSKEEPLIFYRKISEFAFINLLPHGRLFFEIPENKGELIHAIVSRSGFANIQIKKDLQGKERMISAEKN